MSRDPGPGTIPDAVGVLRSFSLLRRQIALYPQGHAMTRQAVEEVVERLNDVFHDRHLLRIELVAGVIHTAGYPFRSESRAYREEIEELARLGVRCLEIDRTVQPGELVATAEVLHELGESGVGRRTLHRRLAERGVEHVRLVGLTPVDTRREGFRWPDAPSATASVAYREALDAGREVVGRVFDGGAPRAETVAALQARIYALVDDPTALGEILAVKRYDNHTFCHSVNVATLAVLFGRRLGLDDEMLAALAEGALLHDVGKRRIPKEILGKAGALSRREWRVMQRHPVAGAEMLVSCPGLRPLTLTIALEHHCGFDGGGYPGLQGASPHALSRVVAVVDTYEALTGARPYREPLSPEEACLALARMAGEKLDPALVRAFVGLITFFPVGSVVRTDRGEVGIVVATSEREPLHPVIALLDETGATGTKHLDTAERDTEGAYVRHVVDTLSRSPAEVASEARAASA